MGLIPRHQPKASPSPLLFRPFLMHNSILFVINPFKAADDAVTAVTASVVVQITAEFWGWILAPDLTMPKQSNYTDMALLKVQSWTP